MTLLHDQAGRVETSDFVYHVTPDNGGSTDPSVYLGATTAHAYIGAYITPDEADELAGALSEGARIARGTALDSGPPVLNPSPESVSFLDGSKR